MTDMRDMRYREDLAIETSWSSPIPDPCQSGNVMTSMRCLNQSFNTAGKDSNTLPLLSPWIPVRNRHSSHIPIHAPPHSSHTNLHPSQIHLLPLSTRLLHPNRQPRLRLPVVKWPLRYDHHECKRSAAETEVEGFVDILGDEASEEGEDAG